MFNVRARFSLRRHVLEIAFCIVTGAVVGLWIVDFTQDTSYATLSSLLCAFFGSHIWRGFERLFPIVDTNIQKKLETIMSVTSQQCLKKYRNPNCFATQRNTLSGKVECSTRYTTSVCHVWFAAIGKTEFPKVIFLNKDLQHPLEQALRNVISRGLAKENENMGRLLCD